MEVDYFIIGQGICGSFLSFELLKAGKKVLVIDESKINSSTKVASGVINPITGRRLVKTWEIDTIMPFAVSKYQEIEALLGISLIQQTRLLDFHPTPQMELAFAERRNQEPQYLKNPENPDQWQTYFNYPFSIGEINPCYLINLNSLLHNWRSYLLAKQLLLEKSFQLADCKIDNAGIRFENHYAANIIFSDGINSFHNPYFKNLPFARSKGEALIIECPELPPNTIFKNGLVLVPWEKDQFWVGSTYEWNFSDAEPTTAFREKTISHLKNWLKIPFRLVTHLAAERPATLERRPFVGMHPLHKNIGLFNGMGTKGCSLAPYFAKFFSDHLCLGTPIHPEASLDRFQRILSK